MSDLKTKCLLEAVNTYRELDWSEEDVENGCSNDLSYFIFDECFYDESIITVGELADFKSLHSCCYEGELPSIKTMLDGVIVIVRDGKRTLVVDGNHRKNTLLSLSVNNESILSLKVHVIVADCKIPVGY